MFVVAAPLDVHGSFGFVSVCENEPPHFFGLPAELRNVIYEDVLGDLGNMFTCFGGLSYVLKDSRSLNL
ncbi:hypothetical protein N0V91_006851 [Didymella pomorum]|uniref:Uncharacterized protein n=1 Tax=Didymella pomorum TaxID=749634 RepID=A0A9W9D5W3_9PLEO|nr:hypothetical protein N0V91_006851 [Didymella pomorum]